MVSLENIFKHPLMTYMNERERREAYFYNTIRVFQDSKAGMGCLLTDDGYFVTMSECVGRKNTKVLVPGQKLVTPAIIYERHKKLALGKIDMPEDHHMGLVVLKDEPLKKGAHLTVYGFSADALVSNSGFFQTYEAAQGTELGISSVPFDGYWSGAPVSDGMTHELVGLTLVKPEPELSLVGRLGKQWSEFWGRDKEQVDHEFVTVDVVKELVKLYLGMS